MTNTTHQWTFFSNHGHVFFLLARDQRITIRQVAQAVGITERSVIAIINDLVNDGYLSREKIGRSNQYTALPGKTLRHPLEQNVCVDSLVEALSEN